MTLRTCLRSWTRLRFLDKNRSHFICEQTWRPYNSVRLATTRVCIVGSGPAGFYTGQFLLKGNDSIEVDIYERQPVPFGLVRYGVAPDHPEVKNVINTFTNTATSPRVRFFGNVSVGNNVTLAELREAYHIVILAYGAAQDKWMGIQGERLPNVISGRKFVGWYNGLPEDKDLQVDLQTDTAVVIGQGNVALDIARILLTPVDTLAKTDISAYSLRSLRSSQIKRVYIVGRRGPLQVAFTIRELRELLHLPSTRAHVELSDIPTIQALLPSLSRPRKRLTELMLTGAESKPSADAEKDWHLKFWSSPIEILPNETNTRVGSIVLGVNRVKGDPASVDAQVEDTGLRETIPCGLVLRSIGYKSLPLSDELPFDKQRGLIKQEEGRVQNMPSVYCSGWLATGPVGVIATTLASAHQVGKTILNDLQEHKIPAVEEDKPGSKLISQILRERGVNPVSFDDWLKLDEEEKRRGSQMQKPREKIVDVKEMLTIVEKKSE